MILIDIKYTFILTLLKMIPYYFKYIFHLLFRKKSELLIGQNLIQLIKGKQVLIEDDDILERLKSLTESTKYIEVKDFGVGSKKNQSNRRVIGKMTKAITIRPKYGRLLANIIETFNYKTAIELGTAFGIGTSYLARHCDQVVTLEGCPSTSEVALETFKELNFKNITILQGEFSTQLNEAIQIIPEASLVYIDGNHSYEATINYFNFF